MSYAMTMRARIAENVAQVRGRIAEAAARSGRPADAVTLVAVTKYVSAELVAPVGRGRLPRSGREPAAAALGEGRRPGRLCRSAGT